MRINTIVGMIIIKKIPNISTLQSYRKEIYSTLISLKWSNKQNENIKY